MMEIHMPRKTLALISGLVVVTIVLFIIALRAGQQQAPVSQQTTPQAAVPTIPAHSVLAINPNPLTLAPGQQGSVNVTIDTSDNNVTAVQLELGYDPNIVSNVKVTPGTMFTNPVVLINKNNPATGRYTYAIAITPSGHPVKGTGVVATVSFTTTYASAGQNTQIGLLPTSLVTARGVAQSVMKSSTGTVLTVSGKSAAVPAYGTGVRTGSNAAGSSTVQPK